MKRIELPKGILEEKYFNDLETLSEIAADFGVSQCCVRANFKRLDISVRDRYETCHLRYKYSGKFPLNETILIKKYSIEEKPVREIAKEIGCSENWIYKMLHVFQIPINEIETDKKIMRKISNKQKTIVSDRDLSEYGYRRNQIIRGKQEWLSIETYKHYLEKSRGSYKRHKAYHKRYSQSDRGKERARRYKKSDKGKLLMAKQSAKKREKGFIPLTESLKEEFEWHHISSDLPYVIAVPKEMHRSIAGNSSKDHFSTVNGKWLVWVAEHPEIKLE